MKKPVLVIMAAGMGSRYGGLKQIDPVDDQGHIIMDFSIQDALEAGFEEAVLIIKKENEADFRRAIGDRVSRKIKIHYAYQQLENLPEGFAVPEGRVKPWGTGHAVLSCLQAVQGSPLAVINADDYYGKRAFRLIWQYLVSHEDDEKYRYAMVGYSLKNTVTDNGYVSRGVCRVDPEGKLLDIAEHTRIEKRQGGIASTKDGGETWENLDPDTVVSMNLWGFSPSILKELDRRFPEFLGKNLEENPLKCEYQLPAVVGQLLKEGKASVEVLHTPDPWYGVTYQEDKPMVKAAIRAMEERGEYPPEF